MSQKKQWTRYRFKDSSTFHVANIKRGAEKRSDDEARELLLKFAHLDPNKGLGKDIVKIEQTAMNSASALSRNVINSNIREIKEAATRGMANGESPKTLNNFMGMTKLSYSLLSNSAISSWNNKNIQIAKNIDACVINKTDEKELSEILQKEKVIVPGKKLHIGNSIESLNKVEKKLDILVKSKIGIEPSKLSKSGLIKQIDLAKKKNDYNLEFALETSLGIKELKGKSSDIKRGNVPKIRQKKRISWQIRKIINTNVDSNELRGLNQLLMYESLSKTLAKGTFIYGKSIGKLGVAVTKGVSVTGGRVVLGGMDLMGYKNQANHLRNRKKELIEKINKTKMCVSEQIVNGQTLVAKAHVYAVHGGMSIGKSVGRTTFKSARFAGRQVAKTNTYKIVSNSAIGRTTKSVAAATTKVSKGTIRTGRFFGQKTKKGLAAPAKILKRTGSKMFNIVSAPAKVLFKGINSVNIWSTKILLAAGGTLAGFIIIMAMFLGIISATTAIGDAVSSNIEEFKAHTSMGKAYEKLLEKEANFSAAVQSVNASQKPPKEFTDLYGIKEYTNTAVKYIDGNGENATNTSTIKGILAMAAIYIDQDFNKYGAFFEEIGLSDSIYKDYCAKLYDSTHIIGMVKPDMSGADIYYCGRSNDADIEDSSTSTEAGHHPALESCNNKTIRNKIAEDCYKTNKDGDTSEQLATQEDKNSASIITKKYYEKYDEGSVTEISIEKCGPHGMSKVCNKSDKSSVKREFIESTGCNSVNQIQTYGETGEDAEYVYVCGCSTCKGHVDAKVYAFVSNIYDPSEDVSGKDKNDSFNNVEKEDAEQKYSMYVLDKYATAFDSPAANKATVYCTNSNCGHYYAIDPLTGLIIGTPVMITKENSVCSECGTKLNFPITGRPGDPESCAEADTVSRYYAEKTILDNITGESVTIVEWWNNDDWFENTFSTTKTYYRLLDETNGIIDTIKQSDTNEDKNVVNAENSTAYWFDCFSTPEKRNNDFAKHGWDEDSITRVRLLMAADWEELYGITDFGYVSGAPLTPNQINALIANNPEWKDLPDWRKAVLGTCASLPIGHPYGWGAKAPNPGLPVSSLDCSGFTQWAYWTATGVKLGSSTGSQSQDDVNNGKLILISADELQPGDLGFKYIGGSKSQSNSNHVGIYAGIENGIPVWCHESGSKAGYKFKAPYSNFTVFFRISPDLVDDSLISGAEDKNS